MLHTLFPSANGQLIFFGLLFAFLTTCILLELLKNVLPRDGGRAYAVNGALSQGKPRGAGIVFILVFFVFSILFVPYERELLIYHIMILGAMISGYLDDSAKAPWGEYKKGFIDLILALVCALTYINFNPSQLTFRLAGQTIDLPPALYVCLAVILIWASINVTNCTDGVDGLSGTVSLVTLISFYLVYLHFNESAPFSQTILVMAVCILGYLWFNASPSRLLMGDAGSRAIGLFIAITAMKSGSPLLFLPLAAVLILDDGLGLLKVSLLRFLKIKILKNTRTPLHDHVRKNKGWSDTQTVFRFMIVQLIFSLIALYLIF